MAVDVTSPVREYFQNIHTALAEAREAKPSGTIDPALAPQDIHRIVEKIQDVSARGNRASRDARKDYAAIETACRDMFYKLLVSGHTRLTQSDS